MVAVANYQSLSQHINSELGLLQASEHDKEQLKATVRKTRETLQDLSSVSPNDIIGSSSREIADYLIEQAGLNPELTDDQLTNLATNKCLLEKKAILIVLIEKFLPETFTKLMLNFDDLIQPITNTTNSITEKSKLVFDKLVAVLAKKIKEFSETTFQGIPLGIKPTADGNSYANMISQITGAIAGGLDTAFAIPLMIYKHLLKKNKPTFLEFMNLANSGKYLLKELVDLPSKTAMKFTEVFLEPKKTNTYKFIFDKDTIKLKSKALTEFIETIKNSDDDLIKEQIEHYKTTPIMGCPAKYVRIKLKKDGKLISTNLIDAFYYLATNTISTLAFGKKAYNISA